MKDSPPNRTRARELAARFIRDGDATGWFEALYREAETEPEGTQVPWADLVPNPHLLNFWRAQPQNAAGKEALIIGCGYGDDAEQFARWGFQTTAFDISETAIRGARRRFPESEVAYVASDVLSPPPEWRQKFDLVFESYTLQVLPPDLRAVAILKIAELVGVSGVLLVIARGREATESEGQMPWPLTRDELSAFKRAGLDEISFEDFLDAETPPVRRFRALYKRG